LRSALPVSDPRVCEGRKLFGRRLVLCAVEQHAHVIGVARDNPPSHGCSHGAERLHQRRHAARSGGLHHARTSIDDEEEAVLLVEGGVL